MLKVNGQRKLSIENWDLLTDISIKTWHYIVKMYHI